MSKKSDSDKTRAAAFSRNPELEYLLRDINSSLWLSERSLLAKYNYPDFPVIFIMGPMRSGTTLLMQWLATTQIVSYPSNFLSRFYHAPIIGAKIQLMLTDRRYSFRGELGDDFTKDIAYSSENGKTRGILAPNEFWYFWRRFLPNPDRDDHDDEDLENNVDSKMLLAELAGIVDVFQKPFVCKGMLFNYNIKYLHKIIKNAIFIQVSRDPVFNMQSVLFARERQFGSRDKWYSFKIKEYPELSGLNSVKQVAGQIYFINKAVSEGLATVPDVNKIEVSYENFCRNPKMVYESIVEKLGMLGYSVTKKYAGKNNFELSNTWDGPASEKKLYFDEYKSFASADR